MITIHKYVIASSEKAFGFKRVDMPSAHVLLDAQFQGDALVVWALVDDESIMDSRFFTVLGTGHVLGNGIPLGLQHFSTLQYNGLVYHVFYQ